MASPAGPSTPTALPIDEEAEYAKQSFTTCYDDYCLIHRKARDSAWYPQRDSYATHSGGPANHHLRYLELSLPCHANHHKWTRLQEPILGDSGHPIHCPVTRPTQGLSFPNGYDAITHGWGRGESPIIQPLNPVDMDDPFQYTEDERVDLPIYQLQN
jgi:hypothetical protein